MGQIRSLCLRERYTHPGVLKLAKKDCILCVRVLSFCFPTVRYYWFSVWIPAPVCTHCHRYVFSRHSMPAVCHAPGMGNTDVCSPEALDVLDRDRS